MTKVKITYTFADKQAFGQAVVDASQDLPLWFCIKLLFSAYWGRTPGQASATLKANDEMLAEFKRIGDAVVSA